MHSERIKHTKEKDFVVFVLPRPVLLPKKKNKKQKKDKKQKKNLML